VVAAMRSSLPTGSDLDTVPDASVSVLLTSVSVR
jgi:hypothetical protein